MSEQPPKRLLVIRGGAIGDFILTLPVLAALRERFPHARLEILGYPRIAALAVAAGLADDVRSIEHPGLTAFFVEGGPPTPEWAQYFAQFELIISYLFDPDCTFQKNVQRGSSARFLVGRHRPDENEPVHAAQVLLRPLQALGITHADPQPRLLSLRRPALTSSEKLCLGAHPGSGSERKNWPEKNWAALLQKLAESTALDFLLIGGEAEGERLTRLAAGLPSSRVRIAQNRPLPELAQELSRCRAFIGHDSGMTHLAAALGVPGLVLWGESNLQIWKPQSSELQVLHGPSGLESLTPAKVLQQLSALLNT